MLLRIEQAFGASKQKWRHSTLTQARRGAPQYVLGIKRFLRIEKPRPAADKTVGISVLGIGYWAAIALTEPGVRLRVGNTEPKF